MKAIRRTDPEGIELNMNPFLDVFLSLIPFLLLSAAFVQLGGINSSLPSSTQEKPATNSNIQDELRMTFEVQENRVLLTGYNRNYDNPIAGIKATFDLKDLSGMKTFLQSTMTRYKRIAPSLFFASSQTEYQNAIAVMNAIRDVQPQGEIVLATGAVE